MIFSHLFFISLIAAILSFSAPLSSRIPKKCVNVTRAKIQETLGKPVKCLKDSKDVECFGRERNDLLLTQEYPLVRLQAEASKLVEISRLLAHNPI